MPNTRAAEGVHGQKTIEVTLRFWTNDIAEGEGKIQPKECWDAGTLNLSTNRLHNIEYDHQPFNSLLSLLSGLEDLLIRNGIHLRHGNRSYKLFAENCRRGGGASPANEG